MGKILDIVDNGKLVINNFEGIEIKEDTLFLDFMQELINRFDINCQGEFYFEDVQVDWIKTIDEEYSDHSWWDSQERFDKFKKGYGYIYEYAKMTDLTFLYVEYKDNYYDFTFEYSQK